MLSIVSVKCNIIARSSFLTVTAVMTGGTQLVEGAHLTGGDTRFCRESSKSPGFYDRGSEIIIPCRKQGNRSLSEPPKHGIRQSKGYALRA